MYTTQMFIFLLSGKSSTSKPSKSKSKSTLISKDDTVNNKQNKITYESCFLSTEEMDELHKKYYGNKDSCKNCKALQKNLPKKYCSHLSYKYPLSLYEWKEWQSTSQKHKNIGHSNKTKMFCRIMNTCEFMKGNNFEVEKYEKNLNYKKNALKTFFQPKNETLKLNCPNNAETGKEFISKVFNIESDDDDFEPIPIKKYLLCDEIEKNEEKFKPCTLEQLVSDVSDSLKKPNKSKLRLTKLPKVQQKDLNISDIEDNQLGFCSQISMDTLFNRCQVKRKSQTFENIVEEDEKEENQKDLESENSNFLKTKALEVLPISDKDCLPEKSGDFFGSQGLFPLSTQPSKFSNKSNVKVCVVTPIMKKDVKTVENSLLKISKDKSIPEPPSDVDLSSFLLEDMTQVCKHENKNKVKNSEKIITSPENSGSYTNIKEKTKIENKGSILDNDSLFELMDDADFCSSPTMISQAPIKTDFKSHGHSNQKDDENTSEEGASEILGGEASPLFLRPKAVKRKKCILDSQPSPNKPSSEDSEDETNSFITGKSVSFSQYVTLQDIFFCRIIVSDE